MHITVGVRAREQARQRRRWQRLRAAVRYKERRDRLVGSDEEDALEEAAVVDAELAAQIGATVYQVGIYSLDPRPRRATPRHSSGSSNRPALTSTRSPTPGSSAAGTSRWQGSPPRCRSASTRCGATRRYAQRNIAHCVAADVSRCGCPDGLILGTADPGGTLERLDPYDPHVPDHADADRRQGRRRQDGHRDPARVPGSSRKAGGCTSTDRSSTPDERGDTTGTGHYDTLLSLIPGARRVQLGTAHGAVICPWDVPDPEHVPDQKVEFLLALHALLIGDAHDPEGLVRTLDADEEALLRDAITTVYHQCRRHRSSGRANSCSSTRSRTRQQQGDLSGANADKLQSLLLRLGPTAHGGTLAHIADAPTTVPDRRAAGAVRLHRPVRPARAGADARGR